ncbi:MAG TPA: hypothetical protein VHV51_14705 [Polyangiaceae bacterium]|nr:hypothetical protein [Polyangiaceae bacterium]
MLLSKHPRSDHFFRLVALGHRGVVLGHGVPMLGRGGVVLGHGVPMLGHGVPMLGRVVVVGMRIDGANRVRLRKSRNREPDSTCNCDKRDNQFVQFHLSYLGS